MGFSAQEFIQKSAENADLEAIWDQRPEQFKLDEKQQAFANEIFELCGVLGSDISILGSARAFLFLINRGLSYPKDLPDRLLKRAINRAEDYADRPDPSALDALKFIFRNNISANIEPTDFRRFFYGVGCEDMVVSYVQCRFKIYPIDLPHLYSSCVYQERTNQFCVDYYTMIPIEFLSYGWIYAKRESERHWLHLGYPRAVAAAFDMGAKGDKNYVAIVAKAKLSANEDKNVANIFEQRKKHLLYLHQIGVCKDKLLEILTTAIEKMIATQNKGSYVTQEPREKKSHEPAFYQVDDSDFDKTKKLKELHSKIQSLKFITDDVLAAPGVEYKAGQLWSPTILGVCLLEAQDILTYFRVDHWYNFFISADTYGVVKDDFTALVADAEQFFGISLSAIQKMRAKESVKKPKTQSREQDGGKDQSIMMTPL